MRRRFVFLVATLLIAAPCIIAQDEAIQAPKSIAAGEAFAIQTTGSGKAALYIVGPNQVLKRDVDRGQSISFAPGTLHNAGHYLVILKTDSSSYTSEVDVLPANAPSELSFLARPSRLPVGLHDGITGAVYVFDAYKNLITAPASVSFEL